MFDHARRWLRLLGVWCAVAGTFLLVGCPRQGLVSDGRYYGKGGVVYRVGQLDEDWRRVTVSENNLAFFNSTYKSIIQVNSTCRDDYEDVPLRILTNHVLYGLKQRKVVVQERRRVDGREALYTEMTARLDGQPIKAAMMVLKKNRCIYDLTYITRPWNFGRGVGDFYRVVRGFRVLSQ